MTKEKNIIEWVKIFIGIIGAIIAGLWTWFTFTDDKRVAENEAISQLDNAISGIIVNCFVIDLDSENTKISELVDSQKAFEISCIQYFQEAFKLSKSAKIHITKPSNISDDDWNEMWGNLNSALKDSYVAMYREKSIENTWLKILETIKH